MILLIPLGGTGERFKKNGYKNPKALINVFGKPIIYYLLDNLNLNDIEFVYIPYNKEYDFYRFEDKLKKDYPNIKFKFLKLSENTKGAAETINISLNLLSNYDCPILCLDGDNFYSTNIINLWNGENKIFTIIDEQNDPIYSYIKLDNHNNIIDIIEKQKISNYACTGAYGFSSYKNLLKYTQYIIDNNITQKNEFYTSTVVKEMIKNNFTFKNESISFNDWHCLGTPIQLKQFCNNFPKHSCHDGIEKIKSLRLCFDLDNTLVTFPKIKNDYTSVEPIMKNIEFLKYLKNFKHTIIIYTARRMKTHSGNTGKIMSDVGKITFDTLDKFDIPYDELYFGKPYADVYIDDLGLNCFDDLEKSLGFYMDTIDPRSFNELNQDVIQTYTKKSSDLSGEIYYYNNIPKKIKDLFPLFLDYDEDYKWYKMEKVNGLTATSLYLSELLSIDNLRHIMNSIKRIQSVEVHVSSVNIYGNYAKKLKERYENYSYSKFENSNIAYQNLYDQLIEYENCKKGRMTVIHGDTVMTNIILNNFGKIKFIDMRGGIDGMLTIHGDWLYDWAKLYQSLIGYDKNLQNKVISEEYENKMINYFKEYFISLYSEEDFNNLKIITNSLLFTLIPLHDNEKCVSYFNLIDLSL
jgi:capsule biosynthesis phosphatase